MEKYWDCSLCTVEPKGEASRCRFCSGKLKGRDRLVHEIRSFWRFRLWGTVLSSFAPGLGQMYRNRWMTGLVFSILIPLCLGLVYVTWSGFSYSHLFIIGSALFVSVVAMMDALWGPTETQAPCQKTCPAGLPVPDYLQLIIDGELEQGAELVRSRLPFIGVIGRICPHPCETSCFRGVDGEPIAINACKRFLADTDEEKADGGQLLSNAGGPRVAVIGAGPAGMSCAYYLSILGAQVTIFDSETEAGGRLVTTIPNFRLPKEVLRSEVAQLERRGVVIRSSETIGPDGTGLADLMRDHDALFLGVGAPDSIPIDIEGSEKFVDFQDLLRSAKSAEPMKLRGRVAVIGGGNAAMDVCRTALRCGADEVHLLYRRDRHQMPAREDEVEAAMREGVHFHFLTNPVRAVIKKDALKGVVVVTMELLAPDSSGRPHPVAVEGSDRMMEFATVIPCLGQTVGGSLLDDPALKGLTRDKSGSVVVNFDTGTTSIKGVYAGGDLTRGSATAVAAIADGRKAALAIYAHMAPQLTKSTRARNLRIRAAFTSHVETPQEKIREEMRLTPLRGRTEDFGEVEEGFFSGQALREARRCLQCHREL